MQASHRTFSLVAVAAALAFVAAPAAHAQAKAAAPAASAAAPAVVIDAEKQKLIDQVLALLHPENLVVGNVEQFAAKAMQDSNLVLRQQGMTQEKIDKTLKDINVDVKKYMDTAIPVAVASAKKNAQPALSPIFAQSFTNDELRQLIAMLNSPVREKFEKILPQAQRSLGEKVAGDVGPEINKDITTMTQAIGTKLQAATTVK
jgi:hypothetical protein